MATLYLNIPDELADQLRPVAHQAPQILELGLRQWQAASSGGFGGAADVFEFLASLPTPEATLAAQLAPVVRERINALAAMANAGSISPVEEAEQAQYAFLEYLLGVAKLAAKLRLEQRSSGF